MDYDFTRFSSKDFEHLVQALMQKLLGSSSIVFGEGRDGARELTFEGEANFPNSIESWNGYWVVQAKFKSRDFNKENDFEWLRQYFVKEMKNFQSNQRSLKAPDNYLMFSNVVLTPVHKVGGRDRIEDLKKEYQTLIPNIFIAGYDEMCRFLDNNRDVRLTNSHLLLTSDLIARIIEKLDASEARLGEQAEIIQSLKESIEKNDSDLDLNQIDKLRALIAENTGQSKSVKTQLKSIGDLTSKYDFSSKLINQALWCLLVEEDPDQAIVLLDESVLKNQEQKLSLCRILKAKALFIRLEFEEAERNFLQAKQIDNSYQATIECAAFYSAMHLEEKSKSFYEDALSIALTIVEEFNALNDLGNICKRLKLYEEALIYYSKQVELLDENFEELISNGDYTFVLYTLMNIGNFYSEIGDYEEAFKTFNILIGSHDILDGLLTKQEQGVMYGNIGICNFDFGDFNAACSYLEKSVELLRDVDKNVDHLDGLSNFLSALGHTHREQSRYQESLISYQESLQIVSLLYQVVPQFYVANLVGQIRDICELYYEFFPEKALEAIEQYCKISKSFYNRYKEKVEYNHIYILSLYFCAMKNQNLLNEHVHDEISKLLLSSTLSDEERNRIAFIIAPSK